MSLRIINRYTLREFSKIFGLALGTVSLLYLVVDFFERIDTFIRYGASPLLVVLYFLLKVPMIAFQVIPPVILVSTLLTLGLLARHNEITVMRASGISLAQIVAPIVGLATALSMAMVIGDQFLVSKASHQAEEIKEVRIKKKQRRSFFKKDQLWYHNGNNIYYVKSFNADLDELRGVTILTFTDQFRLEKRIDARLARWREGNWVFYEVNVKSFTDGVVAQEETFGSRVIPIPETPETFKAVEKRPEEKGPWDLWRQARKVQAEGYDATKYRVDMHAKLSFPFSNLIMVLLGIPFALKSGRSKGLALGVGVSLIVAFLFWLLFSFSLSLGRSGVIQPLAAAWLANFIFASLGFWMTISLRE